MEGHHRDIQNHALHIHILTGIVVLHMFVLASILELRMDLRAGEVEFHMVLLMKVWVLREARLEEVMGIH